MLVSHQWMDTAWYAVWSDLYMSDAYHLLCNFIFWYFDLQFFVCALMCACVCWWYSLCPFFAYQLMQNLVQILRACELYSSCVCGLFLFACSGSGFAPCLLFVVCFCAWTRTRVKQASKQKTGSAGTCLQALLTLFNYFFFLCYHNLNQLPFSSLPLSPSLSLSLSLLTLTYCYFCLLFKHPDRSLGVYDVYKYY